jgi:hypothetical protein
MEWAAMESKPEILIPLPPIPLIYPCSISMGHKTMDRSGNSGLVVSTRWPCARAFSEFQGISEFPRSDVLNLLNYSTSRDIGQNCLEPAPKAFGVVLSFLKIHPFKNARNCCKLFKIVVKHFMHFTPVIPRFFAILRVFSPKNLFTPFHA